MIYLPWFFMSLFYALQYVIRVIPNILAPTIMDLYSISTATFGQMTGIYYIGYALAHIPIGYALDKYGPKIIAPIGLLCTLVGLLPLLFTKIWLWATLGRFLTGAGSAAAILSIFTIIRLGFPEERFGRMLGFTATIGLMGAIYGGRPLHWVMESYSWQTVIYSIILMGVCLCILLWTCTPKSSLRQNDKITLSGIKSIFQNKVILYICVVGGLMVGPMEGFADVWGVEFLTRVQNVNRDLAIYFTSLVFLGFGFGAPLLSLFAEKTKKYYGITRWCAACMGICFFALIYFKLNVFTIGLIHVVLGISSGYQIFILYKTVCYAPKELSGQASAVGNMIIMTFGYLFHSSIGLTIRLLTPFSHETDLCNISPMAIQMGVLIIPLAQILAYGLLLNRKDERKKAS